MISKPPPFKGLNIQIPIIIPIKGRGFINQGSGLERLVVLASQNPIPSLRKRFGVWRFTSGSDRVEA